MANNSWKNRSRDEVIDLCRKYTLTNWTVQGKWNPRAVITSAKGCYIYDMDGTKYLDFSSQYMCVLAGHQNPKIIQAIKDQAEQLCYIDPRYAQLPRAELGRLLNEVTPENIKKFYFCNGGAEANEDALKTAKMYTGKHKFIATYRTYHGNTHGASSVTGESRRWAAEPGIPGVSHVPAPYCYRCDFGLNPSTCDCRCAKYIGQVIEYEGAQNVAGVIVESVIGANGVLLPKRNDYLQTIRKICTESGVLMIVDEVMTGFGRTGEWFGVDNWGVQPDIMTMAKGLTSAHIPLAAVGMTEEIADHFKEKRLDLGATYSNHPLASAAAIAAINVYKDDKLVENSRNHGEYLKIRLKKMMETHPSIGDIRGLGLFHFIELVKNKNTRENFSGSTRTIAPKGIIDDVDKLLLKRGISVMPHPLGVFICPPLCITREELDDGLSNIEEVISLVTDPLVTG